MRTSAVPQEEGPSFGAQRPVRKLLEIVSFLMLKLIEVLGLLLLLFAKHRGILEEVFM